MRTLKAITASIIVSSLLFGLASCRHRCVKGSGISKTEERKVNVFNKITISGAYKVVLRQDSSYSLKVTADDNLLPYIRTEVSGGRLHIFNRKGGLCNRAEMVINVGLGPLEEIRSSGGVVVNSSGKLNVKDIRLDLSGAAKLNLDLNADNVDTHGSGAMSLSLSGQAATHNIDLSGAGDIKASGFVVSDCSIQSSGLSNIEVNVLKHLSVNSSGASTVKYKGTPSVTQTRSGIGSVEKLN